MHALAEFWDALGPGSLRQVIAGASHQSYIAPKVQALGSLMAGAANSACGRANITQQVRGGGRTLGRLLAAPILRGAGQQEI
jgi:hypothetical protein